MDVVFHRLAGLVDNTSDIERAWACFHHVVGAPEGERVAQSRRRPGEARENLVSGATNCCREVAAADLPIGVL